MKKIFSLFALFIISLSGFSQEKVVRYLELRASVDVLGNIYVDPIMKKVAKGDSMYAIEIKELSKIISKQKHPDLIFNEFIKTGWQLISSAHISKDSDGRPNSPFLLYYFAKKEKV
ncbi:MAG: hypothetical protein ACXWV1_08510 [Chitinophagaceae bacterium]